MSDHTGKLAAVTFGYPDEDDDGNPITRRSPGTYTLTVTGLPDTIQWGAGMTVTVHQPKENDR
ncbi:hypothetical protein [Brachybacterium sp. NPDC056505]|uniref:hypothetical protein n=1 Tax=Brachybacterium sp. NPDC056505 TaxID=3345843 RepID=UPI00366C81AF